jgi:thioredoxin-related protein
MKSILLGMIIFCFLTITLNAEPPVVVHDMLDAIALSEHSNKQILVVFTADWCKQCQVMKKDITDSPDMVSDTIVCYLDLDSNKELAKEYQVKTIPDYCILRKRIQIRRTRGYTTKEKFIKWFQNDR